MNKITKTLSVLLLLLLLSTGHVEGRKASPPPVIVTTLDCRDQNQLKVTFNNPVGISNDSNGNLYIIDHNSILKITPDGLTTIFAGSPDGESGSDDGIGIEARFTNPMGIVCDNNGIIYIADTGNKSIRKITPNGTVTTIVCVDEQTGLNTVFDELIGVAVDKTGNLYVTSNQTIQKITPEGTTITLAGEKTFRGSTDGTTESRFCCPSGIVVDSNENLYIADTKNNTIRKITPDGVVSTFAGKAQRLGVKDGVGTKARFKSPWGITIDQEDNLYITDAFSYLVRKITPNGTVSTVAGKPRLTGSSDGAEAMFGFPMDITIDNKGNLYVVDTGNYSIRKIILP